MTKTKQVQQRPPVTTVLNTEQVIDANRIAVIRKYNRTLSASFIEKLDWDGYHVVQMSMIHEHAQGQLAKVPQMRCLILFKLMGRDEPAQGWLDIGMDRWAKLPKVQRNDEGEIVDANPPNDSDDLNA